jgi:hypothetical protein
MSRFLAAPLRHTTLQIPDLKRTDLFPLPQANVMLSYPIPEAEELLTNKLSAAQQSLSNCEEDLDFLREQVTVRCDLREKKNLGNTLLRTHWLLGETSTSLSSLLFRLALHSMANVFPADDGSRHRARVQLGHLAKAQGGEGWCWKCLESCDFS